MKILLWLFLLPLTVIYVAFAIANRHLVTLSLDPTPLSIEAPLYGVAFSGVFVGLMAGGLIAWYRAGSLRRQLREEQKSARRLRDDIRKLEKAVETQLPKPASAATAVVKTA